MFFSPGIFVANGAATDSRCRCGVMFFARTSLPASSTADANQVGASILFLHPAA
jgi:hypothetical protein